MEAPDKKEIRRSVLAIRRSMTDRDVLCRSREIFQRVADMDAYRQAETVFVYMDHKHEVMTGEFIEKTLSDGKKVAVPRVEGDRMHFWYISSTADCTPGIMGIPEPYAGEKNGRRLRRADADETALMILPGLAFDGERHRVGYGGGYYDRYLAEHPLHPTVAVAFDDQLFDHVPCSAHDIRPQVIVTPTRVYLT